MSTEDMSIEWKHASWVSTLGQWAWVLVILNGIAEIIASIYAISLAAIYNASVPLAFQIPIPFLPIWNLIWGIIIILIGFAIIKPKFSSKCANKEWGSLYDWNLKLGGLKIPWMFIWGIILEIFGWWGWGGLAVLVPAIVLIFAGPKKYEWKA